MASGLSSVGPASRRSYRTRCSNYRQPLGFVPGAEPAPRRNLTGDPYFTDGLRAFAILSKTRRPPALLS